MKKKYLYFSMLCMIALSLCVWTGCNKDEENDEDEKDGIELITSGYADLGLTSGTKWKATNEGENNARYTYTEAKNKFDKKIPSNTQYQELIDECEWKWIEGKGFKIIGKNKKAIMMPAAGFSDCDDNVYSEGIEGFYWTSNSLGPDREYRLGFNKSGANINYILRCYHASVRLVQ